MSQVSYFCKNITFLLGEDEEYSVKELINHTPFSRGWQSARFCNYPQEILLEFPKLIRMREIQFLSHQYNIASKIEIYILAPGNSKFKKIGYLSLGNNEKSNFQARELKTVYTDHQCVQVKFNLMRCHTNIHNLYAQVGLIAISILGEYPNKTNDYQNNEKPESNFAKLEDEMIYDPSTLKRLKDLYKAKKKAVELEDFDEAKRIKVAIDSLKSVSQSLIKLEERKKIAIKNDDFDSAKLIKYEIERLKNAVAGVNLNELNKQIMKDQQMNQAKNEMNYQQAQNPQGGYPQQGQKLFPGRQDMQPINNGYEMDADEDIYRIRNNINTGYQLQSPNMPPQGQEQEQMQQQTNNEYVKPSSSNQNRMKRQTPQTKPETAKKTKEVIDVDSLQVGGFDRDFNQLVEEKLRDPNAVGSDNNQRENEKVVDEEIPAADYKYAEPLIPILSFPIVQLTFSSQWKKKEEGFKQLIKEVNDYPNSTLFANASIESIMNACLGVCAYVLNSSISQALLAAMDLIKVLFNKFRTYKPDGIIKSDFDKYSHDCIRLLIEHIGDPNIKLKERAENTLLEFANYSLIGSKVLFEHFISGQIKKTLANSPKHLIGRYSFLTRLILNFGYNASEVPLNAIMTYAIKGYTNPHNLVREAALQLIVNIYKYEGDRVRPYFKELRPAQINTIEDALMAVDGLDEVQGQNEQPIQGGYDQGDGGNEIVNNSQMLNNEQQYQYQNNQYPMNAGGEQNPDDTEHTCQFCGLFDPNITSEQLEIHQFKECPMLIPCFKCNQIVEISGLNYHYVHECAQKKQFKECPRCKEPVLIKDYESHVSDNSCNQFKSPNVANRCPLCHNDIVPAGKVGWEVHLLQQTCPNNPRTSAY